jgi:uncharacterized membrane protein (DUF485 family)
VRAQSLRRENRELRGRRREALRQLGVLVLAFAAATLIAKLFGAGWGMASGFGQIAFATALVTVLLTAER